VSLAVEPPPAVDDEQNRRLIKLEEQVAAVSTAHAVTREVLVERIDALKDTVQQLASRPAPGVPVWVVLVMSIPPAITGLGVLILAIYTVFR
jgi:hypothetical protein